MNMIITYRESNIKAQQSYVSEDITKYPISKNSSLTQIKSHQHFQRNIHVKNSSKHKHYKLNNLCI